MTFVEEVSLNETFHRINYLIIVKKMIINAVFTVNRFLISRHHFQINFFLSMFKESFYILKLQQLYNTFQMLLVLNFFFFKRNIPSNISPEEHYPKIPIKIQICFLNRKEKNKYNNFLL